MAATIGIVGAVGSIGSSILGGITGSRAAGKAAAAEAQELEKARIFQEGVYNTAQTNLSPWITGGQEALGGIEQFLGLPTSGGATAAPGGSGALASYNQFTKTPFYTFPLAQSVDTMNRAAAAKGMSLGSGQLADLGKYGANYASGNFMNYINQLNNLSGVGMTGASNLGQIGVGIGNQVGQTSSGIAAALGSGILGQATAQQNMFQQIGQGLGGLANSVGGLMGPGGGTGSSYAGGFANGLFGTNQGISSSGFGPASGPPVGTETLTPYWRGLMAGNSVFNTQPILPYGQ